MSLTAWNDLVLCTVDDVSQEISDLEIPLAKTTGDKQKDVLVKIDVAKDQIRQRLMDVLPDIFATTANYFGYGLSWQNWLGTSGYTYSDLDSILDKIANPTELKNAAVAATVHAMLMDGLMRWRAQNEQNVNLLADLRDMWAKEYESRLQRAIRVLRLDLDNDGSTTSDQERVRTREIVWPG